MEDREEGLSSLLTTAYKGSWAKLDSQQQTRLLQRLDQDDVFTQQQIIEWLKAEMGITYTQADISQLLSRLKVKLKTGQPVNECKAVPRRDEAGAIVFKSDRQSENFTELTSPYGKELIYNGIICKIRKRRET